MWRTLSRSEFGCSAITLSTRAFSRWAQRTAWAVPAGRPVFFISRDKEYLEAVDLKQNIRPGLWTCSRRTVVKWRDCTDCPDRQRGQTIENITKLRIVKGIKALESHRPTQARATRRKRAHGSASRSREPAFERGDVGVWMFTRLRSRRPTVQILGASFFCTHVSDKTRIVNRE